MIVPQAKTVQRRGYTQVANDVLEALPLCPLRGDDLKVALWILRHTLGFHRLSATARLSTIGDASGLVYRQSVKRSLDRLAALGIVKLDHAGMEKFVTIHLIPDPHQWQDGKTNIGERLEIKKELRRAVRDWREEHGRRPRLHRQNRG